MTCILTGLVGSFIYGIGAYCKCSLVHSNAHDLVSFGAWLVFIGRFLQGLWTGGQQAIEQAYISEAVDKKNNLSMIADLGSAAVLGFVLGPMFGLLATVIDFHIGSLHINHYSAHALIT